MTYPPTGFSPLRSDASSFFVKVYCAKTTLSRFKREMVRVFLLSLGEIGQLLFQGLLSCGESLYIPHLLICHKPPAALPRHIFSACLKKNGLLQTNHLNSFSVSDRVTWCDENSLRLSPLIYSVPLTGVNGGNAFSLWPAYEYCEEQSPH